MATLHRHIGEISYIRNFRQIEVPNKGVIRGYFCSIDDKGKKEGDLFPCNTVAPRPISQALHWLPLLGVIHYLRVTLSSKHLSLSSVCLPILRTRLYVLHVSKLDAYMIWKVNSPYPGTA